MLKTLMFGGLFLTLGSHCLATPQREATVSTGAVVDLAQKRIQEKQTLFLFYKPNSSLERKFVADLRESAGEKVGVRLIALKTGMEPIAQRYEVTDTPSALVYDRRGRLTGKSADPQGIQTLLKKAAGVMRIDWAEEGDENFQNSVKLMGRSPGTGILRTMTLQPEYLKYIRTLDQGALHGRSPAPPRQRDGRDLRLPTQQV